MAVYSSEWDEPDWIAEEDLEVVSEARPSEIVAEPPESIAPEWVVPERVPEPAEADAGAEEPSPEEPSPEEPSPEVVPEAPQPSEATMPEPAPDDAVVELPAPGLAEELATEEPPAVLEEHAEVLELATPETVISEQTPEPSQSVMEEPATEMEAWPPPSAEELDAELEAPWPEDAAEPDAAPPAAELLLFETSAGGDEGDRQDDAPAGRALSTEPTPASDTYEEELMWLGDEFRPSTTAWRGLAEPASTAEPPPEAGASSDQAEELERLARLRGWDEAELSAIRSLLGDQPPAPDAPPDVDAATDEQSLRLAPSHQPDSISLPGADELDEAMSALGPTGGPVAEESDESEAPASVQPPATDTAPLAGEQAPQAEPPLGPVPVAGSPEADVAADQGSAPETPKVAEPGPAFPPQAPRGEAPRLTDEDWLRGRRGPAANAYRRLRRYFPG
jgi:hypothetical protein